MAKLIIILCSILVYSDYTVYGLNFKCPANDIIETECLGPKDCLYPHPERCDQFIHCEVNAGGQSGRPTVKDCPAGLQWNDDDKICDWPASSTCPDKDSPSPSPVTPTKPTPRPTPSTASPTPDIGFTCPVDDIINTQCMGPKDCMYPHPTNCSQFIHCEVNAGGQSGRPTVKDCPAGLEWNDKEKICDWPASSTCPNKETPSTNIPIKPTPSTVSPTPDIGFTCPVDDIINTQCMGPKDCMYPHPTNCSQFIHCEVNAGGQTGRPTVKDCPAGLEWNDKEKICDWPASSTCPNKDSPSPSPVTPTKPTPRPTPSTASPTPDIGFTCPVDDIINTQCMGPKDCMYPHPTNCSQFIHCEVNAGGQTGRPTVKDCPAGLEWNDKEKICDWPASSTCPNKETPSPTPIIPTKPTPSTVSPTPDIRFTCPVDDIANTQCMGPKDCLYPHPKHCDQFIHCEVNADGVTGRPTIKDCPDGLLWNDNIKQCDWPNMSTGCPPTPATPDNIVTPTANATTPTDGQCYWVCPSTTTKRVPPSPTTTTPNPGPDFDCPEEDIINTQCLGPKDCLYPYPTNCNKFIHCEVNADGRTGRPTVKDCPAGLEWNDKQKWCDWPHLSTCPRQQHRPHYRFNSIFGNRK